MVKGKFIELLQVSVGTRAVLSRLPSAREWECVLEEAQRQAIAGILACGIERLSKEQQPPQALLLEWIGVTLQIEQRNALTTKVCSEVVSQMEKDGLRCCVLKGQANHRYYLEGMANRRNCGDVDVWVCPMSDVRRMKDDVKRTLEYVDAHWERTGLCWLHCNFTDKSGVPVEVHFHPSFFSRPKYNRRFQKHFADVDECRTFAELDGVEIPCLKVDEDVIYQMNHIYRHLIDEGVGLRQVVDYYYLLQSWNKLHARSKEEIMKIISWLGMKRFASALMYVLCEVCGMSAEYLLCEPSEKDGKFLMNEIMLSGNFGHNDPRMGDVATGGYLKSRISQASRRFKRNMRFQASYPGEVIWEPIVRVEHFIWKKLKLWRY